LWPEDDSIFSYRDADTIVRMAASLLRSRGVSAGDRILISAAPHPEFLFAFWAGILSGAVVVPYDPQIQSHGFADIRRQVRPKLLLTHQKLEPGSEGNVLYFAVKEDSPFYSGSFSEKLAACEPCPDFPDAVPDQPAVILFTSGSTGLPKGILLSHGAMLRSAKIVDEAYGWRSDDRFLGGGSFHTMSGLRNPCITPLHSGASLVVPGPTDQQNPISILTLCLKYDITILNVTPAFLAYWEHAAQKSKYFQSHKLRMVLSTGNSLHPSHRKIFESQFQCPVYDYYGLTETTGACILETPAVHDLAEKGIGKPWGCIVKICDDGELAIYSDNRMLGYVNDEEATKQRIRSGWMMTGDIARVTADGCIQLLGRKDRMIKDKNGEIVYPEQIESFILAAGNVADVHVTTFRGPHPVEQIAALIQFQEDEEDPDAGWVRLRESLLARMPAAQVPSLFVPVKQLTRGAAGKISREEVEKIFNSMGRKAGVRRADA
jgi:acyl-coenzyme A synthetase/AMP-(fatty) acid ligase